LTHPSRTQYASDWRIVRREVASIGAVFGVGLEEYHFKSPSLRYAAMFYVPKVSVGLGFGVKVSEAVAQGADQINNYLSSIGFLQGGNSDWHIAMRFPLNDLIGGRAQIGSAGINLGPIQVSGATLNLYDNRGTAVVSYEGGSAGVGAGARIDLARVAIGPLIGPYQER